MAIRNFRDLQVWQSGMALAEQVHAATNAFPRGETFGLQSQLRRSAVSVPSNIAEGHARSTREFRRFLSIALGSTAELQTQIELSHRLGYLSAVTAERLDQEAAHLTKMIHGLRNSLRRHLRSENDGSGLFP